MLLFFIQSRLRFSIGTLRVSNVLFVEIGIIGLKSILMFLICSTIVNRIVFILSILVFFNAHG